MKPSCADCRFLVLTTARLGHCRRLPPTLNLNGQGEWPLVHLRVDWCGEYLERPLEGPARREAHIP